MPSARLTAAQLEDLARVCRAVPAGPTAKVARALLEAVRLSRAKRGPRVLVLPGQLGLWVRDGEDLPERPWRIRPHDTFHCVALHCEETPAHVCVARQKASEVQRTKDTCRGEASDYPHCVTERCAQGRGIREALDPDHPVEWRGAGPGKRFSRGATSKRKASQLAARDRLAAVGLLDVPPTVDGRGAPVEREGEGDEA
jgi:hypothetical protein